MRMIVGVSVVFVALFSPLAQANNDAVDEVFVLFDQTEAVCSDIEQLVAREKTTCFAGVQEEYAELVDAIRSGRSMSERFRFMLLDAMQNRSPDPGVGECSPEFDSFSYDTFLVTVPVYRDWYQLLLRNLALLEQEERRCLGTEPL